MEVAQPTAAILAAHNVAKTFPGVRALDDVTLQLSPGRLVALLGENGAGKSTLMSILAGVAAPDRGEVRVDGQAVRFAGTRDAHANGIVAIFQELSLAANLTVAENMFLGREPRNRLGLIDYPQLNRQARTFLERLGLDLSPDTILGSLRVGQQQLIEIARALSTSARVIIMDEPTSALAPRETATLLRLIADLKRSGVAILYATHKLEELADIADDVAIMRDGKLIAQQRFAEISHEQIVQLMVGRSVTYASKARPVSESSGEALRVERASLPHARRHGDYVVNDVSLHVGRGEVVGLFGLVGSGRTELLETIFGAHAGRAQGRVLVDGEIVAGSSIARAIAAGMALAPEDRKLDGLVLGMSSCENAALPRVESITRYGWLAPGRMTAFAAPLLEQLRLKAASFDVPVVNLSGGNQQKVVLAKWLATQPKVLLLDEPTRGIDINAKTEIHALIHDLAARGLAILMASSELPEVLAVSDRILVLCEGRINGEFTRADATPERLMQAALPRTASGKKN